MQQTNLLVTVTSDIMFHSSVPLIYTLMWILRVDRLHVFCYTQITLVGPFGFLYAKVVGRG